MASIRFNLTEDDVRQLLWEGLLSRGFKPAKHVQDITLDMVVYQPEDRPLYKDKEGNALPEGVYYGNDGFALDEDGEPMHFTPDPVARLEGGHVELAVGPLDDRLLPPEWARKRGRC